MLIRIATLLSLMGCASLDRNHKPGVSPSTDRARLQEVYDANLSAFDFGEPRDCDAALWAGVSSLAGVGISLADYLYPGDKPQRRTKVSCWPTDLDANGRPDSRSTFSNDGVIGLAGADPKIAERILSYFKANGNIGEPESAIGEIYLKPNVQIVLQGSDTPTFYGPPKEDFEYHIQVLLILWEGRKYGKISQNALDALERAAKAYPSDYLFAAALGIYRGNMDTAIQLLLKGLNPSSYVRGSPEYPMANWLLAARLVLDHTKED